MRIIHAHKYFYLRAGAERYMLSLMHLQEEVGHVVAPFSMHYHKNDPSIWSDYFVSNLETESGAGRGLSAIKQFSRAWWSLEAERKMSVMIHDFSPDIVHVHNIYTHISPSILRSCAKAEVPVVMTVHDFALVSANYALWNQTEPMDLNHLSLWDTANTRFIKNSYLATLALSFIQKWHLWRGSYDHFISRYFVLSEFVKSVLVQCGFEENKIVVTPPMVDLSCGDKLRTDKGYVLYVGRLENYKGVQTLIEAMREFPNVTLKIAGTGNYEAELRQAARGMSNVDFLGFVQGSPLNELMASARVVVVPSIWYEPFGLVAIEAMACGTPVIVSNRGGLKEIVEDGISGRVFKAGDEKDLARILKEFLHNKTNVQMYTEVVRERAFELSNPERHLDQIMSLYHDSISQE